MFSKIKQVFAARDLRNKIVYTLALLIVFRFAAHIPVPGVDIQALKTFFSTNKLFGLLDVFSGGAMSNFSLVMMGVGPYISASIIMQLLTMIIPSLEALSKEGEQGHEVINQYTRYLTVPLAILEALGMIMFLQRSQLHILSKVSISQIALIIVVLTGGTILLMWIGELITEKGIGNGISLIIFAGIVARFPLTARQIFVWATDFTKILSLIGFAALGILVIFGVVMIERAQRNIPVAYAKQVRGMRMYGGTSTHLPLRVNQAGVIPIIFAMSFMLFPGVVAKFFTQAKTEWLAKIATYLSGIFQPDTIFYGVAYFLLVVAFTYFYTSVTFNPQNISENIQKQGGFIPGIRPGNPTSEYLAKLSYRITLAGALFLGVIAVLPFIIQRTNPSLSLTIGGTALLIVVSVVLETASVIQSQLLMRSYENY